MTRKFSISFLTHATLLPPEQAVMARKLGYDAIGVRLAPAAPGGIFAPLIKDKAMLAETLRRLDDTGIPVFDIEMIRINADFDAAIWKPFLETAAALRAKAILVACDDPEETRLIASFAKLCEAARPYGLTCDLEFMPWTEVKDGKSALRVVSAAGQPNGRILPDSLHIARSGTTLDDLRAIPREMLGYGQICDAPAGIPATYEEMIFTARCARLQPGEGGIDLAEMFTALPLDLPISIEVPHDVRLPQVGQEEWARQCLATSKACIARSDALRTN